MNFLKISFFFLSAFLSIFLLTACHSADEYTGTYHSAGPRDACMELREVGEGVLVRNGEEITFLWKTEGRNLRLYTREGGVVTGKFNGSRLTLTLPGEESIIFKRNE